MLTKEQLTENLKNVREIQKLLDNYRKVLKEINLPAKYAQTIEEAFEDPRSETNRWGVMVHLLDTMSDLYVYGIYLVDYYGSTSETPDYMITISIDRFITLEACLPEERDRLINTLLVKL